MLVVNNFEKKTVGKLLSEDLADIRNSVLQLLVHLLVTFVNTLDKFFSVVKNEIMIWHRAVYYKRHREKTNNTHKALLEKTKFAMLANRQPKNR